MTQAIWTRHLLDIHVLHGVSLRDFSKRCSSLKDVVVVINLSPILLQQPEHLNLQISNLREKRKKNPFLKLEPSTPLQVLDKTILLFSWLWHITHPHLQALNFHNMSLFQIFYFLSFCFLSLDEIKFSEEENNSSDCIKHSRNEETCECCYWNQ